MQELLSKTLSSNISTEAEEFYELCLEDSSDPESPGYLVRQSHAQWSEIDGRVMWDEFEIERFELLISAKRRYERRRKLLAKRGFIYSDMDFF